MAKQATDDSAARGEMIAVPFHNDTVWAGERDGEVLVAMRPLVENLGLQWAGQLQRLKRSPVLAKGVCIMHTPSPGGVQETVCLRLKLIPGWLMTIETRRVKPAIRPLLERYQEEAYEVLWNYFRGRADSPVPGGRPTATHVHNGIEAHLHHHQLRVLAAVKAYGETDPTKMIESTGLSLESVKRAIFLLWYLGVVDAYDDDGVTRYRVIPAEKRPFLPMPASPRQPGRVLR